MKKDVLVALIAVLLVAAAAYTLDAVRPDRPPTPSEPYRPEAKGTPSAPKKKSGKVIMHVNGEPVTDEEFRTFIEGVGQQAQALAGSPQGRRRLAEEFVKLKALEQEGRRLGIADSAEVQSQMETIRAQVIANRALEKLVMDSLEPRIREAYEKEKAGTVGLHHIVVAYQGSAIPPRRGEAPPEAQAMAKATQIAARIRGGADFGQVASAESDDQQSAQRGGALGAIPPDQLPPEIAAVLRTLKPGQISDPVKTQFGIHIFKTEVPTMEQMRPILTQRVQQQGAQDIVERLQKSAKVELDPGYFPQVPSGRISPSPNVPPNPGR